MTPVSVVIPAHNGERYLGRAIDSVLGQEGVQVELIVVDDCSTDGTADVARSYPGVQYVAMPSRGGDAYISTNVGLSHATAEFVAILHQDDLWRPHKLARQVALMESDGRVGLTYSALAYLDEHDRTVATLRSPLGRGDHVVEGDVELRHLSVQNYINVSNAVLRRRALEDAGGFPTDLWFAAEWLTWLRIALRWRVGYVDEVLACFRVHATSQTQTRTRDVGAYRAQLVGVVEELHRRPDLSASLRARRRISMANIELSTMLMSLYWSDRRGALAALGRMLRRVRPWEVPALLRSSAVVPRTIARIRAGRRATRGRWSR
jgi:glycosyltransferase involved in cell wall biosynthesis